MRVDLPSLPCRVADRVGGAFASRWLTRPMRWMRRHGALAGVLGTVVAASTVVAMPGELDPTFGVGGVAPAPIFVVWDVALQSSDAVILAGDALGGSNLALARLTTAGVPDPMFGSGGTVLTPVGGGNASAAAVVVQPDDKIVVAGGNETADILVARYLVDGTPDGGFGVAGVASIPVGVSNALGIDVALQADGKVLVTGRADGTTQDIVVVRLDTDGTPDALFGTGGVVTTDLGLDEFGSRVLVQPDDKILVVGTRQAAQGGGDIVVLRYETDGTLDPTFGTGGVSQLDFGGLEAGLAAALQPDGKVVIGGATGTIAMGLKRWALLTRVDGSGVLDGSFGDAGVVLPVLGGGGSVVEDVLVEPSGSIVAASDFTGMSGALSRFDGDGNLDSSFAPCLHGLIPLEFETNASFARRIARQADGRYVVGGGSGVVRFGTAGMPICEAAHKVKLRVRNEGDPAHQQVKLVWKGLSGLDLGDVGDLATSGGLVMCVLDGVGSSERLGFVWGAAGGGTCLSNLPCWRTTSSGFKYKNNAGSARRKVVVAGGPKGGFKVILKSFIGGLPVASSLPLSPDVEVRVLRSDASMCWEAPIPVVRESTAEDFQGKGVF